MKIYTDEEGRLVIDGENEQVSRLDYTGVSADHDQVLVIANFYIPSPEKE